jgi:hypothetical protein
MQRPVGYTPKCSGSGNTFFIVIWEVGYALPSDELEITETVSGWGPL